MIELLFYYLLYLIYGKADAKRFTPPYTADNQIYK